MITITEAAEAKIREFVEAENKPGAAFRLYVEGGGCSGYQYGMGLDEAEREGDNVIQQNGFSVRIDPMSAPLLNGAVIDYTEGLSGAGFSIHNPNATTTCGCGSSFSA
jgi:iron-sulfur cluster assembly accessory protein